MKHQQAPKSSRAAAHIRPNHTASLHTHIIQRRRHRPRAHGSRVPARDRHDDGVHVGRAHEQRAERPLDPRPRAAGNGLQRYQYRQRPDLAHEARQEALVGLLRDPGPE